MSKITTIQQMWEETITFEQQGMLDTKAMGKIVDKMSNSLTFQDVSDVFSAVYANNYWGFLQMDAAKLAQSLATGLGVTNNQATQYAGASLHSWRGMFSRNSIQDTGKIPGGSPFQDSIDLISNGAIALTTDRIISQWNDVFTNMANVGKNYVYTRCQNLSFLGDLTPTVYMYSAPGGLNLPPSSWQNLRTANGDLETGKVMIYGNQVAALSNGVKGASEGFLLNITSSTAISLFCRMTTNYFSSQFNLSQGNWNTTTWITSNGAAAWHNFTPETSAETELLFYNQDATKEDFIFEIQCRKIPIGTTIFIENLDQKLSLFPNRIIVKSRNQRIKLAASLPNFYQSKLKIKTLPPQKKERHENAALKITMYWKIKHSHPKYVEAIRRVRNFDSFKNKTPVLLTLGSFIIKQ